MAESYPHFNPCRLEFKVVRYRSLRDANIPDREDNDLVLSRDAVFRCVLNKSIISGDRTIAVIFIR